MSNDGYHSSEKTITAWCPVCESHHRIKKFYTGTTPPIYICEDCRKNKSVPLDYEEYSIGSYTKVKGTE